MKKMVSRMTYGAAMLSAAMSVMPVWCIKEVDINAVLGSVIGLIFTIGQFIGAILGVWGILQLVLSFNNDDADSKSRGSRLVVIGLVLLGLKGLCSVILAQMGITVT